MKVAIIFGGKSAEHEVSVTSAKNILKALDRDKFDPVLIGISKSGKWFLCDKIPEREVEEESDALKMEIGAGKRALISRGDRLEIDVAFPVLHGTNGEDGTIQGFLKIMNIPFVGCGVLSSSVAMDKEISKILLKSKGIDVADWIVVRKTEDLDSVEERFGYPVFVKPANLGSSVGVSKAQNGKELKEAFLKAARYDEKVLVEEFIDGRELECSVLGNKNPKASKVGEVIPVNFYSYEEKYAEDSKAELKIPAKMDKSLEEEIRKIAVEAFKANACSGMARVDFLVTEERIYVNELNTIPGFTKISMYPKLWEVSGLEYSDLITELIELAVERDKKKKGLKYSYR